MGVVFWFYAAQHGSNRKHRIDSPRILPRSPAGKPQKTGCFVGYDRTMQAGRLARLYRTAGWSASRPKIAENCPLT